MVLSASLMATAQMTQLFTVHYKLKNSNSYEDTNTQLILIMSMGVTMFFFISTFYHFLLFKSDLSKYLWMF